MAGCSLTVCRGCCCGALNKKDSAQILNFLREQLPSTPIRVSGCLGPCDHKDVIVIHPKTQERVRGEKPVWLGWMHTYSALEDLVQWVREGGPGVTLMPVNLTLNSFRPPPTKKKKRVGYIQSQ
jgi:hypothetical protein